MEWLTKEEIAERSCMSNFEAAKVTVEHHRQVLAATREELQVAISRGYVSLTSGFCGLCERYHGKGLPCPLRGSICSGWECADPWYEAHKALMGALLPDATPADWDTWRAAEAELIAKLQVIQDRELAEDIYTRLTASGVDTEDLNGIDTFVDELDFDQLIIWADYAEVSHDEEMWGKHEWTEKENELRSAVYQALVSAVNGVS